VLPLVRRADLAFVAESAPTPPAVGPVAGLVNNMPAIVSGGTVSTDLNALVDLVATLQNNDSTPTQILVDPLGWAEVSEVEDQPLTSTAHLSGRAPPTPSSCC
jgi:hypothetical protein